MKPSQLRATVLQKHLKKGSTFYPPFTFEDGKQRWNLIDWRRDYVPELLWLGLLVNRFGYEKACSIASELAIRAQRSATARTFFDFGTPSGFARLTDDAKQRLSASIANTELRKELESALPPLIELYPFCPLTFLFGTTARKPSCEAFETVAPVLAEFLYRHERLPMLAQAIHYKVPVASGKHHPRGTEPNIDSIKDFPETEASRHVAGFIRASVTGFTMFGWTNDWAKRFWQHGKKLGSCRAPRDNDLHLADLGEDFVRFHMECFGNFHKRSEALWQVIEQGYDFDLYSPLRGEVMLALACRVYRFAVHIASFLPNWVEDISEVYVRLIVESYINFQWLKKHGTVEHFEKFYMFGLGQQKLRGEHLNLYFAQHGLTREQAV